MAQTTTNRGTTEREGSAAMVPFAFRHRRGVRAMLEQISAEKGHGDLSETLREIVNDYINRYNQGLAT